MKRLVKSHFIKAEKPYEVFAYVLEGPFLSAGQLIGNIINIFQDDEDGKVSYDRVPVFRNPDGYMLDFDHSFVGYDDVLESDIYPLGFEGGQVGLKAINTMRRIEYKHGDNGHSPKEILGYFDATGLKYDKLSQEIAKCNADGKFKNMRAYVQQNHEDNGRRVWDEYYLEIDGDIAIFSQLDSDTAIEDLARQIRDWQELGADLLPADIHHETYKHQIDQLLILAGNMAMHMIEHQSDSIEYMLRLRKKAGCNRVTMETIYGIAPRTLYCLEEDAQKRADEMIGKAAGEGLVTVDGGCVTFSDEIDQMAEWKFKPKEG